jgi:hypothetical protein
MNQAPLRLLPTLSLLAFLAFLLTFLPAETRAHTCGPGQITVTVGEAKLWRIVADRLETTTTYVPFLFPITNGGPFVVTVTPNFSHASKHGDFIIRGAAVGTNVLQVQWTYPPTGAGGVCAVLINVVAPQAGVTTAQTPLGDGWIDTATDQVFIQSGTFRSIIDAHIPPETKKLLVMTQCFAGNVANSSSFRDMPNTCILTGTSPNQYGHYGGYHDDAARTLSPAAGKTATQVHQAGITGRFSVPPPPPGEGPDDEDTLFGFSEFPMTSGTIAPGDFSLEPVTADGNVRSRHLVLYAGKPSNVQEGIEIHNQHTVPIHKATKMTVGDIVDRERIKQNFANQPNTTITTAGGGGTDGWDFPGSAAGLTAAIKKAGDKIKKSPKPELEQFILFMGDHGEQGDTSVVQNPNRVVPPNSRSSIASGFKSFDSGSTAVQQMEQDSFNVPKIGLFLPFDQSPMNQIPGNPSPLFEPNQLEIQIKAANQFTTTLSFFDQALIDYNGDGALGNFPGEGISISFPLMEHILFGYLLDTELDIDLINHSSREITVDSLHLLTGLIERGRGAIPRPELSNFIFNSEGQIEFILHGWPRETYIIEASGLDAAWTETARVQVSGPTRSVIVKPTNLPPTQPVIFRARLLE